MKKILSLLLCLVFICFTLVGCAEDVIGEYLENYNTNKVSDDKIEKLNFYIITGDNTSEDAKITVPQNINAYIKDKYHIELNIKYYTESEYAAALYSALDKTVEAERPDIVLVAGKTMFDTLYEANRLVALNQFYDSRDFKSIRSSVDKALLAASLITPEGGDAAYYTVPNNHVIGEYEYVVIDKAMARDTLHFSNAKIESMTSDETLAELITALGTYYDTYESTSGVSKDDFIAKYVYKQNGDFKDKLLLEYDVDSAASINSSSTKKNYVNILSYPVADREEAFLSAFAIVKHLDDVDSKTEEQAAILDLHYTKCMKIIYALTTDAQLKNMLQYGYVGTNYAFDRDENDVVSSDTISLKKGDEVRYEMNPMYTGNMFISYYCNEIGWNYEVYTNILKQNADAEVVTQ